MNVQKYFFFFLICLGILEFSSKIMLELEKKEQTNTYEYVALTFMAAFVLGGGLYAVLSIDRIMQKRARAVAQFLSSTTNPP